jgi:predicted  nucleic acid-binding Zn-ribbon protein
MKTSKPELIEKVSVRLSRATGAAIRQSGQSASDWLRQAAQNRIDQERGKEPALGKLEKQVDGLQKEIARLQQAEAITQVELVALRKVLVAMQNHQATLEANQVELQRTLLAVETDINNTLVTLGPTLLAAINRQIDQHAQVVLDAAKAKEERLRALVPPAPPRTRL